MARRVVYRQTKYHNKAAIYIICGIVLLFTLVLSVNYRSLQQRKLEYQAQETRLVAELAAEQAEAEDLIEFEKYTQTKKYIEEVAKDKLGMVYEGEIIFKETR